MDELAYAPADSSLVIKIDETTVNDGQSPISISGEVVTTNTTVQDVKLVVGTTSQNVTLSSGHFNVAVARGGLPEGRLKARIVATSTDGIERSATTDVVVDRSAPLAPRDVKIESTTAGTGRISWDKLKDSVLPDGSEGSGVASLSYRYRRTDLSWSGWEDGSLTGFDAPASQLGTAVQTRVEDAAGNAKISHGAVEDIPYFAVCDPMIDSAKVVPKRATVDQMRQFIPTRKMIDGDFHLKCYGEFERVEVTINWVYSTGGDNWKHDNKTPPMRVAFDYGQAEDPEAIQKKYPFRRINPCPSGAADESGDGPGIPYYNWALKAKIKIVMAHLPDKNGPVRIFNKDNPVSFECPNEGQRRAWRIEAFQKIAPYSPVLDNQRAYGDPSYVLGKQLEHDGDDKDRIPIEFPYGWGS